MSPCPKEKDPTQIGHHICERHWLPTLAPAFEQHMELPPKRCNANLTKNPTCLGFEVFILPLSQNDCPTP